ncbi:MAG: hypothetical protein NE334_14540 [Lentisphaeraceae bacterium]|nr:hypothetical protein [Lentisphaeraceae bacterium]
MDQEVNYVFALEIQGYQCLSDYAPRLMEVFDTKVFRFHSNLNLYFCYSTKSFVDAEFYFMKNILEVIFIDDVKHILCEVMCEEVTISLYDSCGHDFYDHFIENYDYELKEIVLPNYIPNMQWKDMVEVYPDYENYLFWNKNKEKHQGILEFTVDFLSWGKTGKAKGIHLFLDVGGDKVWVYIQWWSKFYKKYWELDKVYTGSFLKSHFELTN